MAALADGATSVETASAAAAKTPANPKRFVFIYILHGWKSRTRGRALVVLFHTGIEGLSTQQGRNCPLVAGFYLIVIKPYRYMKPLQNYL
ncbi:unannotated protein [freshwater metagenome]|uniref:Unannotated protein n=1 Tax=freshwater metagenome TaxID=449393 RepID=A0A6J6WX47_9ZZZZ